MRPSTIYCKVSLALADRPNLAWTYTWRMVSTNSAEMDGSHGNSCFHNK